MHDDIISSQGKARMTLFQRSYRNGLYFGLAWAALQFTYSLVARGELNAAIVATALTFVVATVIGTIVSLPIVWAIRKARGFRSP